MLVLIGDVHAEWATFNQVLSRRDADGHLYIPEDAVVIQLGDIGWMLDKNPDPKLVRPVYFIDGNHDAHHLLPHDAEEPQEVAPNLTYIPRGYVGEFDGIRIGFLGGAHSVDKLIRLAYGDHWDARENITEAQRDRIAKAPPVELLLTHTPPLSYMVMKFGAGAKRSIPTGWVADEWSERMVEEAWAAQGYPPLYCGHMHKTDNWNGVHVLRIMEAVSL